MGLAAGERVGPYEILGAVGAGGMGEVDGLAWTPDGREVWVSGRRDRLRQLHALPLAGGERRVLDVAGWVRLEDIAPDGRVLVTMSDQRFHIAAGSPAIRLGEGHAFALSPDGRWALVAPGKSFSSLAMIPTGAGATLILPAGPLATFAFTPDLSAYAFSYWRTTADLYVVDGLR